MPRQQTNIPAPGLFDDLIASGTGKDNIPFVNVLQNVLKQGRGLNRLDPNKVNTELTQYDKEGYARSDADFAKRFPLLPEARDLAISGAVAPIEGRGDPYLQGALAKAGLGDINLGDTEAEQATNLGQSVAEKEARDRNYFSRFFQQNAPLETGERQFGLNATDFANVAAANAHIQRLNAANKLSNQANAINSQLQSSAATTGAIAKGIGEVAGGLTSRFVSPYLNPGGYSGLGGNGPTGFANLNLSSSDPDYGNSNYIGLGDSGSSGGNW